jgi:CheY-like chemotaxis protein/anti-sigma regulatory factor (Ser/Thr protein kinase)
MHFANLVQEIAGMFELEAEAKGLAFRFEAQGALPAVVRADQKRVRQILINLLGNAIKFTSKGTVTFRIRYARELAVIAIEDTGPGLSAQEQARIFEPFTRASTPGPTAPGAGLGLTIAKMLTDLMGGELTVKSAPGEGAVFSVKLFLPEVRLAAGAADLQTGALRPVEARPRHGYAGERRRILVVDNEEADRELLVNLLQPLGFELRIAASGHDCLDLLATGYRPEVILMDLAMPGIDGWETIRRVRALGLTRVHIAIVSANAFDKGLEHDVAVSADDFILKPVRHSELLDWLERRLALTWLDALPPRAQAVDDATRRKDWVLPQRPQLDALGEVVSLGYYRGILNKLDEIEAAQPSSAAFVADMRELARRFQFEAMGRHLSEVADGA